MPDPITVCVLGLSVLVGAVVQSGVGFGVVLVAAPFVVWLAPELMPGAMLVCGFTLPLLGLGSRPRDLDGPVLGAALVGRALLTPVGVWAVAVLSTRAISVVVGALVLIVSLLSVRTITIGASRRNAFAAGAITGVTGTAAAIGGPFVAMTLQHETPTRIRSTLAVFFAAGSAISLVTLGIAGELSREQLLVGLLFVPFLLVGHLLSGPVMRRLDQGTMRTAVLGFCVLAGASVIVRALLA